MKKQVILLLFLLPCLAFGYNWTLFGPAGVKTNDICFTAGSQGYTVICRADGICINDGPGSAWNIYANGGLPAWEAIPYDDSNMLLVMGDGSYSDGIYKFNFLTHQFTIMEYVASPTFIKFCATNQTYYAGSKYDGLLTSSNGSDWIAHPYFISQQVASMDFRENHFVLTTGFQFQCIYNSTDTGRTWNHLTGNGNYITCLAFHPAGKLYGVVPISNSASLRESSDYGQNWDICTWHDDVNTVGFDAVGNVLVGFRLDGVAKYDTVLSTLTYYNEGLPDRCVNRIRINPLFSSITIFCCTNNGVYVSNDYWTSTPDHNSAVDAAQVMNFPNPCTDKTVIECFMPVLNDNSLMMRLYNSSGVLLTEETYSVDPAGTNRISVDATRYPSGIYFYRLKAGKYDLSGKMLIRR